MTEQDEVGSVVLFDCHVTGSEEENSRFAGLSRNFGLLTAIGASRVNDRGLYGDSSRLGFDH
ncbi:hypothetical protein PSET11_00223 [Arthrobacter ulcerisalmonis]|uniref:Uncharacterized protein n=1 Tax=Arthrobacter ulcerisalmonis TaxID=2483813 RepID=A0A3P5WES3_9MICC|nr:hypothetical protein [Arthrobacter ulcerisalmonis]VDC18357.1 hypothetical protein PSET11_00223 [Arthrobacter ulcerisalmonis]